MLTISAITLLSFSGRFLTSNALVEVNALSHALISMKRNIFRAKLVKTSPVEPKTNMFCHLHIILVSTGNCDRNDAEIHESVCNVPSGSGGANLVEC
jgi:hypothetical protein